MSKIEESLGACPWCGGDLCVREYARSFGVECSGEDCAASGPLRNNPTEAASAWLSRFPRLGLPVDPPEGFVRVRLVVWTDYTDPLDAALERAADGSGYGTARASVVVADVPLQTVYPVVGVVL